MIPELIRIPRGSFLMGESPGDKFASDTERPRHRVLFAKDFAFGKNPVTVGEYRAFQPGHAPQDAADLPVAKVCWSDAVAYCAWLGEKCGRLFRLPSEAEWEYACRAGSDTPFSCGTEITPAEANFLYDEHGQRIGPGARLPVGSLPPNAFGLHDLHGQVCEWCADAWHPNYHDAPNDGSIWKVMEDNNLRIIRGGAWDYLPRLLRSSWRDALPASTRRDNLGFRLASDFDN